jgi:hypothetical protein
MNQKTSAILSISIAAVIVASLVTSGMLPTTFMIAQSTPISSPSDSTGYLGHVTYVVRDVSGNIKSYAQTDNTRTVQGINCAQQILFAPQGQVVNTNGTNVCTGLTTRGSAGFNGYNVVGLINGSSTSAITLNGSDTYTLSVAGGTRAGGTNQGIIPTTANANGGKPQVGTVAGTSTYNQITITSPAFAFSQLRTSGTVIRGSVLLNATSGSGSAVSMFAENQLSPTVSVGSSDTLTVTWTITLT